MNRPVKIKPKKPSEPVNIEVEELAEPLTLSLEPYLSEEYARAEGDKLWAKVWQHAGRVEEIPEAGDYLTYDIGDDSILIVRSAPDTIRAYHNVCSHRGRRLVDGPRGQPQRARSQERVRLRLPCLAVRLERQVHVQARRVGLEGGVDG